MSSTSGLGTPPSLYATETSSPTAAPVPTFQLLFFNDDPLRAQVDHLAEKFMRESGNPGLSVAVVVRNPQLDQLQVMLLNYGKTSKENGQPINSDTEYEIASVTKVFTGIMFAEAIENRAIGLDDPIQDYLPAGIHAPTFGGISIKMVDLATHRSGLPRDTVSDDPGQLYLSLNSLKLDQAPGSKYQYSNFGYELLGDILARQAGRDYGSFEFESVSHPLGLMDTTESLSADQKNRLAQGYQYYGSPAPFFPEAGAMGPAGYLHSTINDMARFLVANMRLDATTLGPMLKLAQTSAAQGRNPDTGAGLGWDILHPDSPNTRIWKDGASAGFSSYISFAQDGSSGFVLLTNGPFIDKLATDMIQLLGE
jgi:serine-type D-Ala-D-Ala carboxypeptidase/endopeptidase